MIRALSPFLILLTLWTGAALGAARGQVMSDGRMVICSGAAVVVVGADGRPLPAPQVCPDMALALMTAPDAPPPPVPAPQRRARPADATFAAHPVATRQTRAPTARAPPPERHFHVS